MLLAQTFICLLSLWPPLLTLFNFFSSTSRNWNKYLIKSRFIINSRKWIIINCNNKRIGTKCLSPRTINSNMDIKVFNLQANWKVVKVWKFINIQLEVDYKEKKKLKISNPSLNHKTSPPKLLLLLESVKGKALETKGVDGCKSTWTISLATTQLAKLANY